MTLKATEPYGFRGMTPSVMDSMGWSEFCKLISRLKQHEYREDAK